MARTCTGRSASRSTTWSTRTSTWCGRRPTRIGGCRAATRWCGPTPAAPASRRVGWTCTGRKDAEDFYDVIEWAADAAVVDRQGRVQRDLLAGDDGLAGRRAAAAAPGGRGGLGGADGLLPRGRLPGRAVLQRLHRVLVDAADRAAAQRRRGRGLARAAASPSAARRVPRGAQHRSGPGGGAAAVGGQLGRVAPSPARERRGLAPGRVAAQVAGGAHGHAHRPVLLRLGPGAAAAVPRPLPQGPG